MLLNLCLTLCCPFADADTLKQRDPVHFYNSVTLHGEYYNRARIGSSPVSILGQTLMQLLTDQLRNEITQHLADHRHVVDQRFAHLILTQITLNGALARPQHKVEIETLLYEVRRCLIQVHNLSATTKALLLMTVDLFYSNFSNVGHQLEQLYDTYLTTAATVAVVEGKTPSNGPPTLAESQSNAAVRTISALSSEIGMQGPKQRSVGSSKQEFVSRPLKVNDRLKYVRDKLKSESAPGSTAQKSGATVSTLVPSEQRDGRVAQNSCNAPTRQAGILPTPMVAPIVSDWCADDDSINHRSQQQSTSGAHEPSGVWIPSPENSRNHGNGSPNKYSKSVSPNRGASGDTSLRRDRGPHDTSHGSSTANHSMQQLDRSHDRHLDDLHGNQRRGRGRGRRNANSRTAPQYGDHRDALKPLHSSGTGQADGSSTAAFNGRRDDDHKAASSHSDDDTDGWNKGLETDDIYHHSPVAVKYAEEFLQFLDN